MSYTSNTPHGWSVSGGSFLEAVRGTIDGIIEQCQAMDTNFNTGEITYQQVSVGVENHNTTLENNSTQIKSLIENKHSKDRLPTTGNAENEQVTSIPASSLVTVPKISQQADDNYNNNNKTNINETISTSADTHSNIRQNYFGQN